VVARLPFLSSMALLIGLGPLMLGAEYQDTVTLCVSLVMLGTLLAVFIILARGAQDDLHSGNGEAFLEGLSTSRRSANWELFVAVLFGIIAVSYFENLFGQGAVNWSRLTEVDHYRTNNMGRLINEWLLSGTLFLSGMVVVHAIAFCRRQINVFSRWAEAFDIDLTRTEACQIFTVQPMRYLLIMVIFISLNVIVYQILSETGFADQAFLAQLPLVLMMMLFLIPLIKPVSIIRTRIAEAKSNEIRAIRSALAGHREALEGAQIAAIASEFKAPDLMMYEQYIRDIWEWPVQGYVQRIMLYVLLPPLAWVLAALVERMVDSII